MALSLNTNIIIVTIVFSALALIVVVLRFVTRLKKGVPLALDDFLILPGLLFTLALGACTLCGAYLGHLGEHVTVNSHGVPEYGDWVHSFSKIEWAGILISILAFAFIKASLVLFYRRIFRGDRFYLITAILLGIICCWGVSFFVAILLECTPVSQAWLPQLERTGHCYNPLPAFAGMATTNMIIDIAILAIPQPIVWKLNMPLSRRIAISMIFLLGAFVVGISAARIYFYYSIAANPKLEYDVTYNAAPAFYWTNLDACMAVICASLPSVHILIADLSPRHLLRSIASKISLRPSSKRSGNNSLREWQGQSGGNSTSSAHPLDKYPVETMSLSKTDITV
ncbi:uncharacterized protein F4807DRAFT_432932 [Annulohypoxylon truncatum]|uniref:uncharacterized protein n=1 Tax=Annulohypoxylon truncatum TaxID=327061 RepID=UPI002007DCD5|nr:uncharacterized protein F4807DRAFT_432932 [Annulohypoxylon truncatum]KAI1208032.1 hypothetical protein F4807DRAFT_432932 [Annulohypoxylon truncatum]